MTLRRLAGRLHLWLGSSCLSSGAKRATYDLHNVLGFYASGVLRLIAMTGLVWSFQWFGEGVYWITSAGAPKTELPNWKERLTHSGPLMWEPSSGSQRRSSLF
ncbi:MAG: PepSY-associated TM helix domain-containing protein [Myxococcota bacterium]